jgi:PhnB protein
MVSLIPVGHESFSPQHGCANCSDAIAFYKKEFGAIELFRMTAPNDTRLMHKTIQIDGKVTYATDDFTEYCGGKSQSPIALGGVPITIHRYMENCDTVFDTAVVAGVTPLMPVQDVFWGRSEGASRRSVWSHMVVCHSIDRNDAGRNERRHESCIPIRMIKYPG